MTELNFNIVYDRKHVASNEKAGVIEIRFSMGGKQKYLSTGIRILKKHWKNGRIVYHPDQSELNQRLATLYNRASDIAKEARRDENFKLSTIDYLFRGGAAKLDFIGYCEQRTDKRCVSDNTKTRYRVFTRFLRSWGKISTFSDITVANIRAMDEHLHARGMCQSSVYNYHKYLKLFINDAVIDGFMPDNPYRRLPFKIGRGDKQYVDCLTAEQFDTIRHLDIPTPHLAKARDLFLFQCYTGLAYSDLMAFRFDCCTLVDGKYFYHDRRVKTDVDFVLQLLPPAVDILRRYDGQLPRITNQRYNDYLKAVGAIAGVPQLHSHMGRATAATMFLSKGMSINIVSKVLGHATLRQTQRYARTLNNDVRSAFDSLEDKL